MLAKCVADGKRSVAVHTHHVLKLAVVECAQTLTREVSEQAGIVDEHVDRRALVLQGKGLDARAVEHIQPLDPDQGKFGRDGGKLGRGLGRAGGRDHRPAASGILFHELESDAAIRTVTSTVSARTEVMHRPQTRTTRASRVFMKLL